MEGGGVVVSISSVGDRFLQAPCCLADRNSSRSLAPLRSDLEMADLGWAELLRARQAGPDGGASRVAQLPRLARARQAGPGDGGSHSAPRLSARARQPVCRFLSSPTKGTIFTRPVLPPTNSPLSSLVPPPRRLMLAVCAGFGPASSRRRGAAARWRTDRLGRRKLVLAPREFPRSIPGSVSVPRTTITQETCPNCCGFVRCPALQRRPEIKT